MHESNRSSSESIRNQLARAILCQDLLLSLTLTPNRHKSSPSRIPLRPRHRPLAACPKDVADHLPHPADGHGAVRSTQRMAESCSCARELRRRFAKSDRFRPTAASQCPTSCVNPARTVSGHAINVTIGLGTATCLKAARKFNFVETQSVSDFTSPGPFRSPRDHACSTANFAFSARRATTTRSDGQMQP